MILGGDGVLNLWALFFLLLFFLPLSSPGAVPGSSLSSQDNSLANPSYRRLTMHLSHFLRHQDPRWSHCQSPFCLMALVTSRVAPSQRSSCLFCAGLSLISSMKKHILSPVFLALSEIPGTAIKAQGCFSTVEWMPPQSQGRPAFLDLKRHDEQSHAVKYARTICFTNTALGNINTEVMHLQDVLPEPPSSRPLPLQLSPHLLHSPPPPEALNGLLCPAATCTMPSLCNWTVPAPCSPGLCFHTQTVSWFCRSALQVCKGCRWCFHLTLCWKRIRELAFLI